MKAVCPLCGEETLNVSWHRWPISFLRSLVLAVRAGVYPPKPS